MRFPPFCFIMALEAMPYEAKRQLNGVYVPGMVHLSLDLFEKERTGVKEDGEVS